MIKEGKLCHFAQVLIFHLKGTAQKVMSNLVRSVNESKKNFFLTGLTWKEVFGFETFYYCVPKLLKI